ncbi:hypothetical protein BFW87_28625 [Pseudomonas fluorescens]|uniref:Uncharacterized protein n=1 Tax=Pseudomonas fluorescens TaxID=294 RepID=A0A1T2XXZ6_PSEFL|nr:hypothetical protein [Pseudomonas fluorescens]OPA84698.1 hypothetical protein BFW87_28625 [Pseudomonas fluorescens]
MNPPEPPAPDNFRYFVVGVVCVAVLLGVYFVRLNAQVDQQRAEAAERLTICRQVENIARAALPDSLEPVDACKELKERYSKTTAP